MTARPDFTTAAGTARARARAWSAGRGLSGRDFAGLPGDEPRRARLVRGVSAATEGIGATDGAGAEDAADVEGGAGVDAAAGAPNTPHRDTRPARGTERPGSFQPRRPRTCHRGRRGGRGGPADPRPAAF